MPHVVIDFDSDYRFFLRILHASATIAFCTVAIQIFMFTYILSIYIQTPPTQHRSRRLPYIILSFLTLGLSIVVAVCRNYTSYNVILEAPMIWEESHDRWPVLLSKYYTAMTMRIDEVSSLAFAWFVDLALVYRCYLIWAHRPWVLALPITIYLGILGVDIKDRTLGFPIDRTVSPGRELEAAHLFLSIILNILITGLISFRLIRAHAQFESAIPSRSHKVYLGVVAILVESAAPLTAFGLGTAVASIFLPTSNLAWRVWNAMEIGYNTFQVLSPQLIIFRVTTNRSWASRAETSGAFPPSREIRFARNPSVQGDDTFESDYSDETRSSTVPFQKESHEGDSV